MKNIRYVGKTDRRELRESDFERSGVTGGKNLSWNHGETIEVNNSIGDFLLESPLVSGEFEEGDKIEDPEGDNNELLPLEIPSDAGEGASPQENLDAPKTANARKR